MARKIDDDKVVSSTGFGSFSKDSQNICACGLVVLGLAVDQPDHILIRDTTSLERRGHEHHVVFRPFKGCNFQVVELADADENGARFGGGSLRYENEQCLAE